MRYIEHLEVIDGEYTLVQRPARWRVWLRRVVGWSVVSALVWLAWLMSGW